MSSFFFFLPPAYIFDKCILWGNISSSMQSGGFCSPKDLVSEQTMCNTAELNAEKDDEWFSHSSPPLSHLCAPAWWSLQCVVESVNWKQSLPNVFSSYMHSKFEGIASLPSEVRYRSYLVISGVWWKPNIHLCLQRKYSRNPVCVCHCRAFVMLPYLP